MRVFLLILVLAILLTIIPSGVSGSKGKSKGKGKGKSKSCSSKGKGKSSKGKGSATCSPACVNCGTCTGPNTCTCTDEYTGATCDTPICSPTCMNGGMCVNPDDCDCTLAAGYTGDACETPICTPACIDGHICTAPDTCTCPPVSAECQNGGTCTATGCDCTSPWMGPTCGDLPFAYIGCWEDDADARDLDGMTVQSASMTVDFCYQSCSGFLYFGLQNGDDCFCGNSIGNFGQTSEDDCNIPCAGDPSQVCGGTLRNSAYSIEDQGETLE